MAADPARQIPLPSAGSPLFASVSGASRAAEAVSSRRRAGAQQVPQTQFWTSVPNPQPIL